MSFNTILILVGILLACILIIENMVIPLRAYVLIWDAYNWLLAITCIGTGMLIGYGLKGKMTEGPNNEDDSFTF